LYIHICSFLYTKMLGKINTRNSCMIKTLGNRFVGECSVCNNNYDDESTIAVWVWLGVSLFDKKNIQTKIHMIYLRYHWKVILKNIWTFGKINHRIFCHLLKRQVLSYFYYCPFGLKLLIHADGFVTIWWMWPIVTINII
jgi:hypothetical protein